MEFADKKGAPARNWHDRKGVNLQIDANRKYTQDEFFEEVKSIFAETVQLLAGSRNDAKYAYIVDLLMMRFRESVRQCREFYDDQLQQVTDITAETAADVIDLKLHDSSFADKQFKIFADRILTRLNETSLDIESAKAGSKQVMAGKNAESGVERPNVMTMPNVTAVDGNDSIEFDIKPIVKVIDGICGIRLAGTDIGHVRTARVVEQSVLTVQRLGDAICQIDTKRITLSDGQFRPAYANAQRMPVPGSEKEKNDESNANTESEKPLSRKRAIPDFWQLSVDKSIQSVKALNECMTAGRLGDLLLADRKKILERVKKFEAALRPKTIFERIFDFVIDQIKSKFMMKFLKRLVPGLFNFMNHVKTKFMNAVKGLFKNITGILDGIGRRIRAAFNLVRRGIMRIYRIIKRIISRVLSGIMKSIRTALRLAWQAIKFIVNVIWQLLKLIGKFVSKIARWVFNKIKNIIPARIREFFKNALSKLKGLKNKLGQILSKVSNFVKNCFRRVTNFFKGIKNFFSSVKQKIVQALKNVVTKAKQFAKKIVSKVVQAVKNVVRTVVKKVVGLLKRGFVKIAKKIGAGFLKKIFKKRAKKMGMNILVKWFRKFLVKLIAKLGAKIAAATAANLVPILGQVVSAVMLAVTIADVLYSIGEIYTLFKENPMLWDVVKEQVAEYVDKAFNVMKDAVSFVKRMLKTGAVMYAKVLKALFVDMPKAVGHKIGDSLFSSNKKANQLREKQVEGLKTLERKLRTEFMRKTKQQRRQSVLDSFSSSMQLLDANVGKIKRINDKIASENDAWWRDMDKIMALILERGPVYESVITELAKFGLFFQGNFFDFGLLRRLVGAVRDVKKRIDAQIQAEIDAKRREQLKGCSINFGELAKMLSERRGLSEKRLKLISDLKETVCKKYEENKQALLDVINSGVEEDSDEYNDGDSQDDDVSSSSAVMVI